MLNPAITFFKLKNTPTDFEYTARNCVKKIFSALQEFEFVEYFKLTAKLHYGHTIKEAVTLTFQYGKEHGVLMPDIWMKNECAAKTWQRGLRKCHESLCWRKPESTALNRSTTFNHENVKAFFENIKECKATIS
jgi:hypothetical protein